jgi:glycosyltransferase involved in cell wall biosynthesis
VTTAAGKVVILDDFFPNLASGFRVAEYNWLLKRKAVAAALTTQPLAAVLPLYAQRYPDLANRVFAYSLDQLAGADLAWIEFLNNAIIFLDDLEATGTPFVVTLYPGGGLTLGDGGADRRLERVLASPCLKGVIATQPRVAEAVRSRASAVPVYEVPGIVVSQLYLGPGAGFRKNYFGSRPEFHVCFAAYKYTPHGEDKGYDVFLDVVRKLRAQQVPVKAHIIGGFTSDDSDVSDLAGAVTFHGPLETRELKRTFGDMDVIISPNRPGVLAPYAFDGFPLGAVVEAALCGVAVVATDELAQNRLFRDGRDIVLVKPIADEIVSRIIDLFDAPGGVARLAQAGLATVRRAYGVNAQLWPRLRVLQEALSAPSSTKGEDGS